jgi:hypothetical protein
VPRVAQHSTNCSCLACILLIELEDLELQRVDKRNVALDTLALERTVAQLVGTTAGMPTSPAGAVARVERLQSSRRRHRDDSLGIEQVRRRLKKRSRAGRSVASGCSCTAFMKS